MSTVELTTQTFEQTVTDNDIVLVDWWAEWCGPCKQFGPIFEQAATRHEDIVFGKVDTEAQRELAADANITSIPTVMAFREGILVFAQPGALPAPSLESLITQVRDLDMAALRRQIADADSAEQDMVETATADSTGR